MPAASTRRSGARPSRRTGSSGRWRPSSEERASRSPSCSSGSRPSSRPGPIVVRVDEVGRAEAVAYEAATAQADPLDPTTKYFLNRFISDFYSQAPGHGRGALDAEPAVPLDRAGERRVHEGRRRGRRDGGRHLRHRAPGRAGRAPHPPRTGGAARRDRRFRPGPPPAGAGDPEASGGRSRSGSRSSPSSPPSSSSTTRWASSSPTSRPTVPWSRSRPG